MLSHYLTWTFATRSLSQPVCFTPTSFYRLNFSLHLCLYLIRTLWMFLALILSRTHRFYLPPWPSVPPGVQPSAPLGLALHCFSSSVVTPGVWVVVSPWQQAVQSAASFASLPFTWRTSGAELRRNLEAQSGGQDQQLFLNDSVRFLIDSLASESAEPGVLTRSHLPPNMHWKAFLKLLMEPVSEKTCGIRRQFVSESLGLQWQAKDAGVWLNLDGREEKGSDGLEWVPFDSYEIRWDKKTLEVCDYRCRQRRQQHL